MHDIENQDNRDRRAALEKKFAATYDYKPLQEKRRPAGRQPEGRGLCGHHRPKHANVQRAQGKDEVGRQKGQTLQLRVGPHEQDVA